MGTREPRPNAVFITIIYHSEKRNVQKGLLNQIFVISQKSERQNFGFFPKCTFLGSPLNRLVTI